MNTRPNIIVMICDDLGYGDLGCYGASIATPVLDGLAAGGARFTDFHSGGVVCSPTRAALLTGRFQERCGITGVVSAANHRHVGLDPATPSLGRWLREAGYRTALFGKWHLGYDPAYGPPRHGFESFRGFVAGNVDYHSHIDQTGRADWWRDGTLADEPGYATDLVADHTADWIRERAGEDGPWMTYVGWPAPHYPYQGPDDPPERTVGGRFPVHGARAKTPAVYAAMIAALDAGVGRILRALDETGQRRDTLILFTSDHGAPSDIRAPNGNGTNAPYRSGKGKLYEGGHRVALLASWPGTIAPGQTPGQLTTTVDLTATVLAAAGVPATVALDGRSLLPCLRDGVDLPARPLYWRFNGQLAMRDGQHKLVIPAPDAPPELYDLASDPSESYDLAASQPDRVADLLARLTAHDSALRASCPPLLA